MKTNNGPRDGHNSKDGNRPDGDNAANQHQVSSNDEVSTKEQSFNSSDSDSAADQHGAEATAFERKGNSVERSNGKEQTVTRMVTEGEKYKAEIDANKNRIEAKNSIENYCYSLNSSVSSPEIEGQISVDDKKKIFSKEESVNQSLVAKFIVPNHQHSVQEVFNNTLKGVDTSSYKLEFRIKSNDICYHLVNVTTRKDTHLNIVGVV